MNETTGEREMDHCQPDQRSVRLRERRDEHRAQNETQISRWEEFSFDTIRPVRENS